MKKKSYIIAVLLTVFFGKLGVFYTHAKTALALILITLVAMPLPMNFSIELASIASIMIWAASIAININNVSKHNNRPGEA